MTGGPAPLREVLIIRRRRRSDSNRGGGRAREARGEDLSPGRRSRPESLPAQGPELEALVGEEDGVRVGLWKSTSQTGHGRREIEFRTGVGPRHLSGVSC